MHNPLTEFLQDVESWVLVLSSSLWIYPAELALVTIDGFFPPVPSESVVITLAVAAGSGGPELWAVLLIAVVGAWLGDQVAYAIGRAIGTERLPMMRTERGRRVINWARHALAHRGASFILAARYVPIGRVAVNMSAGAVGFPRKRFMAFSGIAAVVWGVYSLGIGILASQWLGHNTLLAMAVGVAVGIVSGLVLDRVVTWWTTRHGHAPVTPIPELPAVRLPVEAGEPERQPETTSRER
ncbi:DedA family protein [Cellulomonas sp. PhB143]|uniref:DedA family protein n=1 Tax=Cellulomonas sp. PhB143 TaxID=2485186 RepID=UPI000F4802A7|nr:DedA family protein [Cellulomonas sp. PhB143]ROS76815.1 membrane protein DedA with SNARE-associated domain [Cellulomonas sp. PhB143]